ncbi:MAG TPA: hypothetical protein VGJ08_11950 [Rhizomicrobium sp.]
MKSRKKVIRYTEGEIGKIGPVLKNLLPPPVKLVLREDAERVTASRRKATPKPL